MTRRTTLSAIAALALTWAGPLHAQCPDGSPPPCRGAAPARRPNPPLDERTWIVVPFENVTRADDIDWLREASVNLLYLDMSRWRDIRVIDDERVADYVRAVPEARAGPLGLQSGIMVARRAGAGKLVMGDLLKVGSRTQVVAKVFDVRTGQRLRSVREETSNPDSLMAVFVRLARGILNVEPPSGASANTIGTTSLGAYQEYVAGVRSLSAWDLSAAQQHFEHAVQLDSGFALAHYKLSVVWGWERPNAPLRVAAAEAANRFATGLPTRERTLITGQLAQAHDRWGESCDAYMSLVRADSTDVEAWYNVGECSYHDPQVVAIGGDTTRLAFRGNWNTALRAFRRTLELDPTYHLAFAHIPDILQADQRAGCTPPAGQNGCPQSTYLAQVIRDGDSLVLTPVPAGDAAAQAAQAAAAQRTGTRHANLTLARDLAAAWVQAGPDEPRAHLALGRALLRTGDLAGADRELHRGASLSAAVERVQYAQDRTEVALKLGRTAEAAALYDSVVRSTDSLNSTGATLQLAIAGVVFGRFARLDQALRPAAPPAALPFLATMVRTIAGVPPDSLERRFQDMVAAAQRQGQRPADVYGIFAPWALRWMRAWSTPAVFDSTSRDPRVVLTATALRGDTSATRRALARFDSIAAAIPLESPENGMFLVSAEVHLILGDSAAALDRMLESERRWPYAQVYERLSPTFAFGCFLWTRDALLLADLAAAQGRTDVAVRAYRRVIGQWGGGDPEVQPVVARARAALAALGS